MQENGPIGEEMQDFFLKDKTNLDKLEDILDDLLDKLKKDEKEFKTVYQNLPLMIYNKIDSLRITSLKKKSEDFKRVAKKAKDASKAFHNKFK